MTNTQQRNISSEKKNEVIASKKNCSNHDSISEKQNLSQSPYLYRYFNKKDSREYSIRHVRYDDLPSVFEIEKLAYPEDIWDGYDYFNYRRKLFPEGFFVLVDSTGSDGKTESSYEGGDDAVTGFFCCEIWNSGDRLNGSKEIIKSLFRIDHSIEDSLDPNGDFLYLANWSIHPKLRGTGIGQIFFNACFRIMRANHPRVKKEGLIVSEGWKNARHIYKKHGFVEHIVLEEFFTYKNELSENAILMLKEISKGN